MLLVLGLLGAHERRVLGPGREGHPGVIQNLETHTRVDTSPKREDPFIIEIKMVSWVVAFGRD